MDSASDAYIDLVSQVISIMGIVSVAALGILLIFIGWQYGKAIFETVAGDMTYADGQRQAALDKRRMERDSRYNEGYASYWSKSESEADDFSWYDAKEAQKSDYYGQ